MSFQCLSAFGGGTQITVCTEGLVPGRHASQAHYHMLEDEHVLILDGSLTVRLGEKNFVLSRGLYACWDGVAF